MKRSKKDDTVSSSFAPFIGCMKAGVKNGRGVEFENETVRFQGEYKNGFRDGMGIFYRHDGSMSMMANFVRGVPWTIKIFNETFQLVCAGQVKRSRLFGSHYDYQKLQKFEGSMTVKIEEDRAETSKLKGILFDTFNEQIIYDGSFQNDVYHGRGKLFENGNLKYNGEFLNGLKTGRGKLYHGPDDYTQCSFVDGVAFGTGMRRSKKFINFDGIYHNGKYQSGRLYFDVGSYFVGTFTDGVPSNGKIYRNGLLSYEGGVQKKFEYSGQGRLTLPNGNIMSGFFRNNFPEGEVDIFYNDSLIFHGIINNYDDSDLVYNFFNATMMDVGGRLIFRGSMNMDPKTGELTCEDGERYVNGIKRIVGDFVNNFFEELYDENGIIMLKDPKVWNEEAPVEMRDFDDNLWPRQISGYWKVFDENGAFMYEALFRNGSITTPFLVANKVPVEILQVSQMPDDMISFEPIEQNAIVFFLNQNPKSDHETKHVISGSTLRKMKENFLLGLHPFTRVPIIRIRRAKFVAAVQNENLEQGV